MWERLLGLTSIKQRIECQRHNTVPQVRPKPVIPQSQIKQSTTEQQHSCIIILI